jgi:hypothetical protein
LEWCGNGADTDTDTDTDRAGPITLGLLNSEHQPSSAEITAAGSLRRPQLPELQPPVSPDFPRPMSPIRPLLPLVLAALSLAAAPCPAQTDSARDAMANAMARMMEAMGFLGGGAATEPWSAPMQAAEEARDMLEQMPGGEALQAVPGMTGWTGTSLDGVWEGREGGLLIVQGPRFRLYAPTHAHIDGLIQQRGDRIAMYTPRDDVARPYEFALQQGRLVLRDAAGQLYLYRRLWQDQPMPGSAAVER